MTTTLIRQTGPAEVVAQALEAEERRLAAMRDHDLDTLDELLSQDLRYTFSSGKVEGHADFMAGLRSGALRYGPDLGERDLEVVAYTDNAVILGILDLHIKTETNEFHAVNRFSAHWGLDDGQWRMLSWQSTTLPAA
jgi:hypothetical protein